MNTIKVDQCRVTRGLTVARRHRVAVVCLVALGLLSVGAAQSFAAPSVGEGQPRLAFFAGTNTNGIFDQQTIDFIANHAAIIIINAPLAGSDGSPSYAQVITGLHKVNPHAPVLLYFWATRAYSGATYGGAKRAGIVLGQPLSQLSNLTLKNPQTGGLVRNPNLNLGNVASPAYQQWLIGRVKTVLSQTGADGVMSDVTERQPYPEWCHKGLNFCTRYANGVDNLFATLAKSISPKLVIFNGLWGNRPGRLEQQEKLLSYSDGAFIEFFGRRTDKPIPSFEDGIVQYWNAIQHYPSKQFMVFGRGTTSYADYLTDYEWQRYLYAAYLMTSGPNTSFRYLNTFQLLGTVRADMLTLYDDVATRVGTPDGPYKVNGDIYSRKFSNGIALLVPRGGHAATYVLTTIMYGPAGDVYKGSVIVRPGEGLVLFKSRPAPETFRIAFSAPHAQSWIMPDSRIVTAAGAPTFLQMQALPSAKDWAHDVLLSPLKAMHPSMALTIRLRTKDPSAGLLVVAEVDDKTHGTTQAVVNLRAGACAAQGNRAMRTAFRSPTSDVAYPVACAAHFIRADGQWHTYTIPVAGVLPSRFTITRWQYVRFIGAVDLQSIDQP